ncbi:MAG: CRISPR-associated endonuclease Cas2 [Bacteroidota bacterium]|nr:CRISPR-associated endonuclease Cas2 [Bacteroidota bacterium]
MSKKKTKQKLSFIEQLKRIKNAGVENVNPINRETAANNELEPVETRVRRILNIFPSQKLKASEMIYFVMYDIENNKVRTHIAKYLIKKGCSRVQKSIFLAETDRKTFSEIHKTLVEVQEVYDNNDSIFLVPISTDEIKSMKMIGQNIDFDMILSNRNTLFF